MEKKGRQWSFDGEEAWYRLDESIVSSRQALSVVFLPKQA